MTRGRGGVATRTRSLARPDHVHAVRGSSANTGECREGESQAARRHSSRSPSREKPEARRLHPVELSERRAPPHEPRRAKDAGKEARLRDALSSDPRRSGGQQRAKEGDQPADFPRREKTKETRPAATPSDLEEENEWPARELDEDEEIAEMTLRQKRRRGQAVEAFLAASPLSVTWKKGGRQAQRIRKSSSLSRGAGSSDETDDETGMNSNVVGRALIHVTERIREGVLMRHGFPLRQKVKQSVEKELEAYELRFGYCVEFSAGQLSKICKAPSNFRGYILHTIKNQKSYIFELDNVLKKDVADVLRQIFEEERHVFLDFVPQSGNRPAYKKGPLLSPYLKRAMEAVFTKNKDPEKAYFRKFGVTELTPEIVALVICMGNNLDEVRTRPFFVQGVPR